MCKSFAPHSRQKTMPAPYHSIFRGQVLFLAPYQQCQSTDRLIQCISYILYTHFNNNDKLCYSEAFCVKCHCQSSLDFSQLRLFVSLCEHYRTAVLVLGHCQRYGSYSVDLLACCLCTQLQISAGSRSHQGGSQTEEPNASWPFADCQTNPRFGACSSKFWCSHGFTSRHSWWFT